MPTLLVSHIHAKMAKPLFSLLTAGRKGHPRKVSGLISFSTAWGLLLGLMLSLQFALPVHAVPPDGAKPPVTQRELNAQIDPSAWKLSPEAKHLYFYLLLSEGMSSDSSELVSAALKGLLRLDPSLAVYQDGTTILLARGEFDAAEKIGLEGLKQYPDDSLLTLILSGVYSENDQVGKAMQLLEKYLEKRESAEITEELVRLYLNEGLTQKASDLLGKMPEKAENPESELFRAKVLASVGRYDEGRKVLNKMLEENPEFYEAWVELGYIAEKEKDSTEAIKAYRKAISIVPDNPEVHFRIAGLQIQAKLPSEALQTMVDAAAPPGLYIQAALRFANGKYYKEANTMLSKAADAGANPDEVALFASMFKQESAKDPLEGLTPLESISPQSNLYSSALQQKVRIYLQAKDYATAHQIARDSRELFPERREIWGLEAYALVKLQEGPEAERLLKKALERYPNDEQLMFSLGVVQDEAGKKNDAVKTMERIISANPRHFQALNYVGYTLAENNRDLERAHKLIVTALEESPDADYIVDSLAWVQFRMGKYNEAWATINRCIDLGGDEATIWEHYGDIATALKKYPEARKGYAEALLREPANIDDVRRKLTNLQGK